MPPIPTASPPLSSREKLAFSLGGSQQAFGNLPKVIISPVYNVLLGVNPALIGLILLLNRIGEILWEPLVGLYADRRVRRGAGLKSMVALGGLLLIGILPLMFLAQPGWPSVAKIGYLLLTTTPYYFGLSLFTICINSLLVNRTSGGPDRSRLAAWFTSGSIIAIIIGNWTLPYILSDLSVQHSQMRLLLCTGAIAIAMVAATFGIYHWVRESVQPPAPVVTRPPGLVNERSSYAEMLSVLRYRPVLILLLVNAATQFGSNIISQFGFYVKGYYMFGGDVHRGALWAAIAGTVFQVGALACMPLFRWSADRLGKRNTVLIALGFSVTGEIFKWFVHKPGVDPLWLPFVALMLAPYGVLPMLVLSILGDVGDWDEALRGRRRIGTMVGAMSISSKVGLVTAPVLSGLLLNWSGFDILLGATQSQTTLMSMRIFYTAVPLSCAVLSFGLMLLFPLGPHPRSGVTGNAIEPPSHRR